MIPEQLASEIRELKGFGYDIEYVIEGQRVYIVFKDFDLPAGPYNVATTELMVFTTTAYPSANFDMFWTSPTLTLKGGGDPQSAAHFEQHLNKNWRRFSIHPYNVKPWDPNEDCLHSYLTHIIHRLNYGQ